VLKQVREAFIWIIRKLHPLMKLKSYLFATKIISLLYC
jgi:hypothetical protein